MRTIKQTTQFKKDLKRVNKGVLRGKIEPLLKPVLVMLASDHLLPESLRDHNLSGNWEGFSECHLKPDLLLIYKKEDCILRLVRIGSHSDLF